jgi:hypothetical protein
VSLIVKGESASGKSYIIKQVLRLFPDDAYLAFTSMSNKALAYTNEALSHRMLVLYEARGPRPVWRRSVRKCPVPESVRETVAAVASLIARGEREVPLSRLADALNLGRSTASRRVKLAAEAGYLQNLETRKGRPARVVLGVEIPNQLNLLPEPEELERER